MEPVNQQDINNTFWKFLAVFTVTVALIIAAVYYDAIIPRRELIRLKAKEREFQEEKDYQNDVRVRLKELNTYFNSLDSSSNEGYNLDYLIGLRIADLEHSVDYRKTISPEGVIVDSTHLAVYDELINTLKVLHKCQLENMSFKRMVKPMQDYKTANDQYREEYDRLQSELTKCQGLVLDAYKNRTK